MSGKLLPKLKTKKRKKKKRKKEKNLHSSDKSDKKYKNFIDNFDVFDYNIVIKIKKRREQTWKTQKRKVSQSLNL